MRISAWRIISLISLLADELTEAAADGKITVSEGLHIIEVLCRNLGIDFDEEGFTIAKQNVEEKKE